MRKITTQKISETVTAKYSNMLLRLVDMPWAENEYGDATHYRLTLDEGAYEIWKKFSEEVEQELREGGEFADMTDWAGKLPGQVVRLAGLFHVSECENPSAISISAKTMENATVLGSVLADHAKAAFALMGSDEGTGCALRILKWLVADCVERFTARDAHQKVKGKYPNMERVRPGLKILEERGYIRGDQRENAVKGRGRKPSPEYYVNPHANKKEV